MQYNEVLLIKASQEGNSEAFGHIYDHYIRAIYSFVYYKTRHKETAEDLTSQTFFKALRSIGSVDPEKPFVSWLYKIAHNTVLDHYRTRHPTDDIDQVFDISDTSSDFVTNLDELREAEKVRKYLSNLTETEREIITLRIWQELSYKEIAEVLDKSEASCKMMYSRAIKKLRTFLP